MAKKGIVHRMTGPGRVLDRSVKKGKLVISVDVSPNGFISKCREDKGRLKLVISGAAVSSPIEILVEPHAWKMLFEAAAVPKARLADLERLITEESDVQLTLEYTPEAKIWDEGSADEPEEK